MGSLFALVAAVSRDHFLELTDYTRELATSSTSSATLAPELIRANIRASYYTFSLCLLCTGGSGPIQLIT